MYNYDTLCTTLKHTNQSITNMTSVEIILCKTKKVLVLRNKKIVKARRKTFLFSMVCIKKSLLISLLSPKWEKKTAALGKMSILCQNGKPFIF